MNSEDFQQLWDEINHEYTEQEINQIVDQIDNMHLTSRNEGELLFRCKWIIRQLQERRK